MRPTRRAERAQYTARRIAQLKARDERVADLYVHRKMPLRQIARVMDLHPESVRRSLARSGIKPRPRSENGWGKRRPLTEREARKKPSPCRVYSKTADFWTTQRDPSKKPLLTALKEEALYRGRRYDEVRFA